MAQPGTYTAYRQLKPLEGDVSQDIQQQEENGFRRNAIEEQRARNRADAEAKIREAKDKELAKVKEKYPVNPDVKVQTLTDFGSRSLRMAVNRIDEISNKLYGNKKLDPEEDEDALKNELNKLQNTPELLKNSASALTTQATEYKAQLSEGKIRPNLKFENFTLNGATGWEPHFVNGELMIAFMDKDVNNDGVIDKLDLVSYDDLAGHTGTFKFDTAYDRTKLREADVKTLKTPVNQTDDATTQIKTTAFTNIDKSTGLPVPVLERANNLLYGNDGTPTDVLRDFAYTSNTPLTIKDDKGNDIPNTKGLSKLVVDYAREVNAGLESGKEVEKKDSALDYQKEANDQKNKNRDYADKKAKEDPKPVVVSAKNVSFTEDVVKPTKYVGKDGKMHITNPKIENDKLLPKGFSFTKGLKQDNIGGERTELNNVTINTVFKGKDGRMYFTAKVLDEKSSGEKTMGEDGEVTYKYGQKFKAISRQATGETAAIIARAMGYDSEDSVLNAIDELNGVKPGQKPAQKEDLRSKYNY